MGGIPLERVAQMPLCPPEILCNILSEIWALPLLKSQNQGSY